MSSMKAFWTAVVTGALGTASTASADSEKRVVAVTVDSNGFSPAEIKVVKGQPTTLLFTRTTDATCAKAVAFPELGIERALPLNVAVSLEVPVASDRTLGFQCGMGMFKSKVVIQ